MCPNRHTKIVSIKLIVIYECCPKLNTTYIANLSTFVHSIQTFAAIAILWSTNYVRDCRLWLELRVWNFCGFVIRWFTVNQSNTIRLHNQERNQK